MLEEVLREDLPERCREHEQPGFLHQVGVVVIDLIDASAAGTDKVMPLSVWLFRNLLTVRDEVPQIIETMEHLPDGRVGLVVQQ